MELSSSIRRLAVAIAIAAVSVCGSSAQAPATSAATFGGVIAALSEPNGYFDTDNLISNEQSYLTVLADIERAGLRGGAYIGVGPDQNFSYIAAARPSVAFIVDVRRDNLLLHLLFKALFALSRTRIEYLSMLCGRAAPADIDPWRNKSIDALSTYVDQAAVPQATAIDELRARVTSTIATFGVTLSDADRQTIDRFHRRFIDAALSLRFQSYGRGPQSSYPTLRDLLLAVDGGNRQQNYLASEDGFQFLKGLQAHDRVIPLVGNLTGPTALVGIGRWLREHDEQLALFYASNVEFYLFREGSFDRFVANLSHIPHGERALMIRSVFGYGGGSVSQTQPVPDLLEGVARGRYRDYWQLVR
ncbi:MAG: hypothetical protein ABIX28_16910 [Vicinamibacterales bacterium]